MQEKAKILKTLKKDEKCMFLQYSNSVPGYFKNSEIKEFNAVPT